MANKVLERLQTRLADFRAEQDQLKIRMAVDAATLSRIADDIHWTRMTIQDEEDRVAGK